MTKRKINWKLLIVLLLTFIIIGVTVFWLRQWQTKQSSLKAYDIGLQAYENYDWEKAARYFGKYLNIDPKNKEILVKYAQSQLNIRPREPVNLQQAIASYRRILRSDKNHLLASKRLVNIYLQMEQPGEAELIASRYLKENENPEIQENLAIAMVRQRKFSKAALQLQMLIQKNPGYVSAYHSMGLLTELYPDKYPGEVKYWYDEAVNKNPESAKAYVNRALFYLRKDSKIEALKDLEVAEKIKKINPETRVELAKGFALSGDFEKANKHFGIAEKEKPEQELLWTYWGNMALELENKELMNYVADHSLKYMNKNPWDIMPLAVELYIMTDQQDKLAEYINEMKLKGIRPDFVAYLHGLKAQKDEDYFTAIAFWKKAQKLGYDSGKLNILLAKTLYKTGDNKTAIRVIQSHVSKNPGDYRARMVMSKILFEQKDYQHCLEQIEYSKQLNGESTLDTTILELKCRMELLKKVNVSKDSREVKLLALRIRDAEMRFPESSRIKLIKVDFIKKYHGKAQAIALLSEYKKEETDSVEMELSETDLLMAQNNTEAAISKLKLVCAKYPQKMLPVKYLASILFDQGKNEEAEKVLQEAIERINNEHAKRNLTLFLGMLYKQEGKKKEAYTLFKKLSEKRPDDIIVKRELLDLDEKITSIAEKQKMVDEIKELEGEDGWQWRYEQAKIWLESENFESSYPEILSLLEQNLKTDPEDIDSLLLLGKAYYKKGELQLAVATFKQALQIAPEDISVIVPTVNALYKIRDYEQAEEVIKMVRERNVRHPELFKLELESYLRQDYSHLVKTTLEDCLSRGPMCKHAFIEVARRLAQKGDKDSRKAAENLLNAIIEHDPNCPSAYNLLAMILQFEGRCDEAERLYEKVIELDPNNLAAVNNLAWILAEDKKDYQKAFKLAQEGLDKAPDYLDLLDTRGVIHYRMGNYLEAKSDLEKCINEYPVNSADRVISYFHYGRVLAAMGKEPEAMKFLEKAVDENLRMGGLSLKEISETKKLIINLTRETNHDPETR